MVNDMRKEILGYPAPENTCEDKNCPFHGTLPARPPVRIGKVISMKRAKTAAIEIRTLRKVPKYERYMRVSNKIHARVPECIKVSPGDLVAIAETRRLAKTVSHVVIGVVKGVKNEGKEGKSD